MSGEPVRLYEHDDKRPLLPWMLSFLRPYRPSAVVLAVLLIVQIVLGALQPWPLKLVIDNILNSDEHPFPEPLASWMQAVTGGSLLGALVVVVMGGVLLQVINQFVTAWAMQVWGGTA